MNVSRLLLSIALVSLGSSAALTVRHLRRGGAWRGFGHGLRSAFPSFEVLTFAMFPPNQRIILLAGTGLGVLLCLAAALCREPAHKGEPLSYWVDRACQGYDSGQAWDFRSEVKEIGPPAVPLLVKRLRVWDGWRNLYRSLITYVPSRWQLYLPDVLSVSAVEEQRYGAARTLAMFGTGAKPAVRDLVRLLPNTQNPARGVIIQALQAIGPDAKRALPSLRLLLTNQDISLRVEVAGAIWHIGWETNTVLEVCTNAMVSGDSMNAGVLLSYLREAAAPAVPYALLVLQDTNHQVGTRANAATVLGSARVSTPEIRQALLHGTWVGEDTSLRSNCAMALWRLDSQYAPLATRLVMEDIMAQNQRFPHNQQDFARWLEVRGLDFRESIPTLQQLLASDSPEMRKETARALRAIGAATSPGRQK